MTDYSRFGTYNAVLPKQGPKVYPQVLDFRAQGEIQLDMQPEIVAGHIDFVSGVFVDNSVNNDILIITTATTNQVIKFPKLSQGYLPLLITDSAQITFRTTPAGDLLVPVQILNFPVWPHIWSIS